MKKPILVLDFDGVMHSYTSGWQGASHVADPPVPGLFEFLRAAVKAFDVQVFSSRSNIPGGVDAMRIWLIDHATDHFSGSVPQWLFEYDGLTGSRQRW